MDIGFIGCGLIGGSLIKSLDKNAAHNIHFFDTDPDTVKKLKIPRARALWKVWTLLKISTWFLCVCTL
ncbi:MAG: hypothetical protein L6V93_16225 [Clostridiales bacterium]|nr:MAG: hypothetical protein L6V93_16225 [Clostridiales bacterium]